MRMRNREIAQWERAHPEPVDRSAFLRTILPGLQNVSVRTISRATGLSSLYCSQIRRGLKVPHSRHWEILEGMVQQHQFARTEGPLPIKRT